MRINTSHQPWEAASSSVVPLICPAKYKPSTNFVSKYVSTALAESNHIRLHNLHEGTSHLENRQ
jgi:hypothetical protein